MSCIHYKFKSSLDYDSVTFDGLHMSLADLKKSISQKKHMKPGEFDLEITNAQTGDVYKKNDELIAKNTSVIVSRVPINKIAASSTQKSWEAFKQECAKVKEKERQMTLEKLKPTADVSQPSISEIDKIKTIIDQSTKGFEPSHFVGKHQYSGPPDNYLCRRCSQKGHFWAQCPNVNSEDRYIDPKYKRTTGIPSTMLTIVDDPMHPGALLTHHGQFAVPTVDVMGYRDGKKERPPFLPGERTTEPEKKIPKELLCHICEDLCVDAAIAPCCGTSFCDECLREVLLESDDHKCPSCAETNVSPDRIVPNRSMRIAVTNFLNDSGYTKVKKPRSSSQNGDSSQAAVPNKPLSPVKPSLPITSSTNSSVSNSANYREPNTSRMSHSSYNDANTSHASSLSGSIRPFTSRTNIGNRSYGSFNHSYSGPPRYSQHHYSKPWRNDESAISTISRRNDDGRYSRYREDESLAALHMVDSPVFSQAPSHSNTERSLPLEPPAPGTTPVVTSHAALDPIAAVASFLSWPPMIKNIAPLNNAAGLPVLPAGSGLVRPQLPLGLQPSVQTYIGGFQHSFSGQRPPLLPPHTTTRPPAAPPARQDNYHSKKSFQTEPPRKKPVDIFESFADLTKRRSRTPERPRSYSRSRSGSWNKKGSRTPSHSPEKRRSRSLTPRRFSPRSRSRSRPRSQNRSRSKSGLRTQKRSRSRSRSRNSPRPLNRSRSRSRSYHSPRPLWHRPQSRSPKKHSKSRSRSRSFPRQMKPLSPRPRSPFSPLRRSPAKSPLPPLRSRSRSFPRFSRSRSKSWVARARSRSFSRPRSPRPKSRSPKRSPKRSPYRSPLRRRSFSPRRRSRSLSPRRSPIRSRSRTPLPKRKLSRSKTRSPIKRRSYTPPRISPPRSRSPIKKPASPPPFKRHSPLSPFRVRGNFRGRGRGGFGFRDREKFRPYRSPPRALVPPVPNIALTTGSLPPVPYFPQMGLPPPEEYFKDNPHGYQEFVRSFYAQFGPQAQTWAQDQTFPLPLADRLGPPNIAIPNMMNVVNRPAWEQIPVPMSPPQRPRSLTPPNMGPYRDRKDQTFSKDRDIHGGSRYWDMEKSEFEREQPRERRLDRGAGSYRGRDREKTDHFRDDMKYRGKDAQKDFGKETDYNRNRDNDSFRNREAESFRNKEFDISRNRESENSRHRETNVARHRETESTRHRETDGTRHRNNDGSRHREDSFRHRDNDSSRSREVDSSKSKDKEKSSVDRKRSPSKKLMEDKNKDKGRKKTDKGRDVREVKRSKKTETGARPVDMNELNDSILAKTSPVSDRDLESPDHKPAILNPVVQSEKPATEKVVTGLIPTSISETAVPDSAAAAGKTIVKEKKAVKKKGEGVTGKKKVKDAGGEQGTDKKVKKIKKKKLTFGASDVDTKQGLKNKKLKRLVDYKSENCTSEEGEEKVLLGNSPLKKSKLAEEVQPVIEVADFKPNTTSLATVVECDTDHKLVPAQPSEQSGLPLEQTSATPAGDSPTDLPDTPHTKVAPELPELSKWEREDFDYFDSVESIKEKPQEKTMLPRSVVDKAEKFLAQKPMKNAVIVTSRPAESPPAEKSPPSKNARRVFLEHRKDIQEKKLAEVPVGVRTDKRKDSNDRRAPNPHKAEDHHRHHHDHGEYEEDQRSVVKSCSLERELHENKPPSRSYKEREGNYKKEKLSYGGSGGDSHKPVYGKREKPGKSPETRERKDNVTFSQSDMSKSSHDLRHKLEDKSKAKAALDHRKLSVMDESEFVPDYEDLGPDSSLEGGQQDVSNKTETSSAPSVDTAGRDLDNKGQRNDEAEDTEEHQENQLEGGKKKSKKKHKHKEKKEKHKHKKKKHKHKKDKEKEGKVKGTKEDSKTH